MKRSIIHMAAAAVSVLMAVSCSDWAMLEEHPKKVDATTFMSNAEEVRGVINSIYGQLERDAAYGRYLSVLPEALSDMCCGRGNYNTDFYTGLTSGAQGMVKDTWAVLYRAIRYSNDVLAKMGDAQMSKTDYMQLNGEARYLRAFSYSILAKYFGAAPLFDENNADELYGPRVPEEDIWKYVISETEACIDQLPGKAAQAGRPTRYSALLLNAEAHLYLKEYGAAKSSLKQIVDSKKYRLVEVAKADDFEKLYGATTITSSEEVFYIKYNVDVTNRFVWMYMVKPNPVYQTGALGIYTDYKNNYNIAGWDKADLRYQFSLYDPQTYNGVGNATLNSQTKTGMICLKYRDYNNSSAAGVDFPVYRYADVLLMYAEAICMDGGSPDDVAMECINMLRRRAYGLSPTKPQPVDYSLSDYSDKDKFMELLIKEHGYETIFESKRYCFLKRIGRLPEYAVKSGRIALETEVGDAAYWWPIPADEFNYNPYMDPAKDQNPGY